MTIPRWEVAIFMLKMALKRSFGWPQGIVWPERGIRARRQYAQARNLLQVPML